LHFSLYRTQKYKKTEYKALKRQKNEILLIHKQAQPYFSIRENQLTKSGKTACDDKLLRNTLPDYCAIVFIMNRYTPDGKTILRNNQKIVHLRLGALTELRNSLTIFCFLCTKNLIYFVVV